MYKVIKIHLPCICVVFAVLVDQCASLFLAYCFSLVPENTQRKRELHTLVTSVFKFSFTTNKT